MKYILVICSLFSLNAFAGEHTKGKTTKNDGFSLIQVAELDKWIATPNSNVHIYDANRDNTRTKNGLIPGATTLTNASQYDTSILPANKTDKLVFYCANTKCMASHDAAKVAVKAGYTNVYVMSDGIEGWKKAGKSTSAYSLQK